MAKKINRTRAFGSKDAFLDMPNEETWTLHQIAKIFKISHERVRQIEHQALQKLRDNPDMHELRHLIIEE